MNGYLELELNHAHAGWAGVKYRETSLSTSINLVLLLLGDAVWFATVCFKENFTFTIRNRLGEAYLSNPPWLLYVWLNA